MALPPLRCDGSVDLARLRQWEWHGFLALVRAKDGRLRPGGQRVKRAVKSRPLEGSQGGSTRKPQAAVVVGIGKLLVEDAFPAGVINAGLTRPAPTGMLATADLGQPRRVLLGRSFFGRRVLCCLAGPLCTFRRRRPAQHFQGGFSVGDYFATYHLIFIVRKVAGNVTVSGHCLFMAVGAARAPIGHSPAWQRSLPGLDRRPRGTDPCLARL